VAGKVIGTTVSEPPVYVVGLGGETRGITRCQLNTERRSCQPPGLLVDLLSAYISFFFFFYFSRGGKLAVMGGSNFWAS
jgi:hypothetical protein